MVGALALRVVLVAMSPAPDAELESAAPWEHGASERDKEAARELFRAGNALFEDDQFGGALEQYREAAALWDHPGIHFNITVCLINLDQPVAAHEHLERALEHGAHALGSHFATQAITYKKLLLGRLARLDVGCRQPGVEVTVDGKHVLSCPGEAREYLLPGEHQLVADGAGYAPVARSLDLRAGETTIEEVELVPPHEARRFERRWKTWVPWIPVAAGGAVLLAGVGLRLVAVSRANQFDREVARLCPQGCVESELPESVRDLRSGARAQNAAAITFLAAGGGAVLAGGVLLILNRRREVDVDRPDIAFWFGRGAAGISHRLRF